MNLRNRLVFMSTLTVLYSILISAIVFIVTIGIYTGVFKKEVDINAMQKAFEIRAGLSEIKKVAIEKGYDYIIKESYRNDLFSKVHFLGADAYLIRNRSVEYASNTYDRMRIEKYLAFSDENTNQISMEIDGKSIVVQRADFQLQNGDKGILLLTAPGNFNSSFYIWLIGITSLTFIIVFLSMNIRVSAKLSQLVIQPVSRLQAAAVAISEGNLECEIAEEGEGEVKELCKALEVMRIRLKEAVYLQQKLDDNRKFLVSSISHDLKTPVTSVIGHIHGILEGIANSPEKVNNYLSTALSKAVQINAMIDDLLLYSKLDLNQMPFNFEKVDLLAYFTDYTQELRTELQREGISLKLQNQVSGNAFILMDRERFGRVIQNIMDNSRKYVRKDEGSINVIIRETATSIILEIKDNGLLGFQITSCHIYLRDFTGQIHQEKVRKEVGLGLQ